MHERTQRAFARLMFVLCCALPTCLTLSVLIATRSPWYHRHALAAIEIELSNETGLLVEIDDFERASPNLLRLHGIVLSEPESTREVARVRLATWATLSDRSALQLSQPEIHSEQLEVFWRMVHDRFMCRPDRTSGLLRVVADDLTVHSSTGPMTFIKVDSWLRPHARLVEATIECFPANAIGDTPVRITVRRDRSQERPATEWSLQSGETPLPCSAIADFSPLLERLGHNAKFSGQIQWKFTDDSWLLNLQGSRFTQVDLSRLFETLPHRLSGTAEIAFDRGYIDPYKRVDVHGSIIARDGYIGDSLIRSAREHLRFGIADDALASATLPFDRLGLRFNLMGAQLQLNGICAGEPGYESLPPGVALCANGWPIAWTDPGILPSVQLARAIAPDHSAIVPIAQQTASIMSLLLPPSRHLPTSDSNPSPRITRRDAWSGAPPIDQPASPGIEGSTSSPPATTHALDETTRSIHR